MILRWGFRVEVGIRRRGGVKVGKYTGVAMGWIPVRDSSTDSTA